MTDNENVPKKREVGRLMMDAFNLLASFIGVSQFVISENSSSQWFKPARDWIADRLDVAESLASFSDWWNRLVGSVFPVVEPFDTLPIQEALLYAAGGIMATFAMGLLVPIGVQIIVLEFRKRTPNWWRIGSFVCGAGPAFAICVAIMIWRPLSSGAPPWVWFMIGVSAPIGFFSFLIRSGRILR